MICVQLLTYYCFFIVIVLNIESAGKLKLERYIMDKTAKYMHIVSWAIEQFTTNKFHSGDLFLSEVALGQQFSVSRQTVRRAMEELEKKGYITRIQGRGSFVNDIIMSLKQNEQTKVKTIGVVATYIDDYIFPGILRGIEGFLAKRDINMQVKFTKNTIAGELYALQQMLDSDLDGLLVWASKSGLPCINLGMYNTIRQRDIPLVFIDSFYPEVSAPRVMLDDEQVGYIATKHLIDMGHRNIACVLSHSVIQGHLRYRGYIKAILEAGLPVEDEKTFWYSKENQNEILNGQNIINGLSDCSAVFCFNDQLAMQLIERLRKNGKKVPEDISIVGVDNCELSSICALTSIIHPKEHLGEAAAELLLSMVNGREGKNKLYKPELVQRQSVRQVIE